MRIAVIALPLLIALPLSAWAQAAEEPASATGASRDAAGRVVLTFEAPTPRHRAPDAQAPQAAPRVIAPAQPRRVAHKGAGEAWTPAIALNQPRP